MNPTRIHFEWLKEKTPVRFRTGISLHSHTLHSRESLGFIYHAARHSALLRWTLSRGAARYEGIHGGAKLDLNKAWWTPPLAPRDAYNVESDQITAMGMNALVSLTDHDDIEAPMSLQAIDASRNIPVSVEWTVPFDTTFFHIGVHNLSPKRARGLMQRMREFTASPDERELRGIFSDLARDHRTLIVLNHPLWDESGIGAETHRVLASRLVSNYGEYLHAVELNGLRPWSENRAVIRLGEEFGKPVISGGDRHALEPNATLNLTNTACFSDFVDEIRGGGGSDLLITSHYRESFGTRIFHNMLDVLRIYEDHGLGWRNWSDRVFYTREDGTVASLSQIWGDQPPAAVGVFVGFMQIAGLPSVRQALRSAAPGGEKVFL